MKPLVTVDELRRLMPQLSLLEASLYAPYLHAAMWEFEITTKPRRCAFLSQLAHESSQLRYFEEIADGSDYEGRKDLGNTRSGDGMRFKGRGPIQLTGRTNYRRFGTLLSLPLESMPELAAKPENGFRIAGLFWKVNDLNELADALTMQGDAVDRSVFTKITKKINGGTNGLNDRLNYFRVAKQVLHNDPVAEEATTESVASGSSPAVVSPDPDVDLLDAAVSSGKAKSVGLKLWPRLVRHFTFALGWASTMYEAHKFGAAVVLLLILAVVGWVLYHNRKALAPTILKLLK